MCIFSGPGPSEPMATFAPPEPRTVQTNNPLPGADYTGRQDPGNGYLNEYDVLQRDLENLGIFPVAPASLTTVTKNCAPESN